MAKQEKTIKERTFDLVRSSLEELKLPVPFSVDYPEQAEHGDYSTNAALVASKIAKRPALEIAYEITGNFKLDKNVFEKTEVSSKGFINFFLRSDFVLEQLASAAKPTFGASIFGKGQKINVEFISLNPTGQLHVGHGRGAFYGDALSKMLKLAGFEVAREYYVNDAKASNQIRELGRTVLGQGQSYFTPYLERKLKEFDEKGFSFFGLNEAEAGRIMAQAIQEDIREFIEEKLNIKFDVWFSEESLYEEGLTDQAFQHLQKRGLVYESEGALWLKSAELGDVRDRVLVRSQEKGGTATYFYTDLAYYLAKAERGFDAAVYIVGADHHDDGYFLRLLPKLFERDTKVEVILTQLVSFKKQGLAVRLSKRKGEVIDLQWLLDQIGLDAARFFYLQKSVNTHIEFDVDLAKAKNLQNPVYYIQYCHARLSSILRKAKEEKMTPDFKNPQLLATDEELQLVKNLLRFPELVVDVAQNRQVHAFTHYLQQLAVFINSFYEKVRVIEPKNRELTLARLGLIQAAKNVMGKVLELLGMSAPVRM